MRSLLLLIALVVPFAAPPAPSAPTEAAPGASRQAADTAEPATPEEMLASMDWLAGSWSGDMWGGRFHAFYSTPAGGKILSHSRLMHGDKESFYEFEVFEVREQVVHLQPFPRGSRAGGFTLAALAPDDRTATFENPDKDYPTRITYQCVSEDKLLIELSDPHGESDKVERFELSRG